MDFSLKARMRGEALVRKISVSAPEPLLRHPAVIGAGQPGRRAFVEALLGTATDPAKPSRRLVGDIAKAVQDVCAWWL